jgi:hypothetical protein
MYSEILSSDDRNEIPDFESGVYYVTKSRTLATFEFGKSKEFKTAQEASVAMKTFLSKRKDAERLIVQVIERFEA